MDRDGHQGWSRASETGWDRVFGVPSPRVAQLLAMSPNVVRLYCSPGEIISDGRAAWRVTNNYRLEEVEDAGIPT